MRVLHVIPAIGPSYGGPSTAIAGMTESLAARGIEVDVATTDRDGAKRLDVTDDTTVRNGVAYHFFPTIGSSEWKLSLPLARWLRTHVRRYELVHVHGLFCFSTIPACRSAHASRVPYVLRPLGTLSPASLQIRSWKKWPYFKLVERTHLARAAAIHVTSDQEAHALRALGFNDRVRVVPLAVATTSAPARAPRSTASSTVRLLFVGRLHPMKQLPLLFNALALAAGRVAQHVELVIAGDGDPAYREELRATLATLGLEPLVRFTGQVDPADRQRLLASADVFVLPSRAENFGIAAAEALAAGLPVILTEHVGLAADVARARAGVVVASDASRIADAIAELCGSAELRARMGACAGRLALERFSWSRSAEVLEELYRELLVVRRGPRRLVAAR